MVFLQLSQYLLNVTLEYKPGSVNKAADAFSRAPVGKAVNTQTSKSPVVFQVASEVTDTVMDKVRHSQREDQELAQLMDYLEEKSLPIDKDDAK